MNDSRDTAALGAAFAPPPCWSELRVKGRRSEEQWASWFDDLTISTRQGESILQGRALDHAALYGLLARLRDLAVPLVSVRVLDEDAQIKLSRQRQRYYLLMNLFLGLIYLLLLGGLSAITVYLAPYINVALALALLFAATGGLAHLFRLWGEHAVWRWIALGSWVACVITALIYIPISGILPTAMGIAVMLLLGAGGLIYLAYCLRYRFDEIIGDGMAKNPFDLAGKRAAADRRGRAAERDAESE